MTTFVRYETKPSFFVKNRKIKTENKVKKQLKSYQSVQTDFSFSLFFLYLCEKINVTVMTEEKNFPFAIEDLSNDPGFLMLQVSNLWGNSHDRVLKRF